MVDADRLADRTDAKRSTRLGEGDEQPKLCSPTEATSETPSPVVAALVPTVFVLVPTAFAVMTMLFRGRVFCAWIARTPGMMFILAAVGAPTAPERKVSSPRSAESGVATETVCASEAGCVSGRPEPSWAAAGAASPLQARQRLGDLLAVIVRAHTAIVLPLIVHTSILHVG